MLNVKQIFHYQMKQEKVIFFYLFKNGREHMKKLGQKWWVSV